MDRQIINKKNWLAAWVGITAKLSMVAMVLVGISLSACKKKEDAGPMEKLGKKIDKQADKVEKKIEGVGEKIEKGTKKVKEKVAEGADKVSEKLRDEPEEKNAN